MSTIKGKWIFLALRQRFTGEKNQLFRSVGRRNFRVGRGDRANPRRGRGKAGRRGHGPRKDFKKNLDATQAIKIELDWNSAPANLLSQRESDVPVLVVQFPDADEGEVEEFPLSVGKTLKVGRNSGDIVIAHRSVSATHCSFALLDGVVFLSDEGSTNGTFLNKQKLRPRRQVIASDGDEIYIGQVRGQIRMPVEVERTDSAANQAEENSSQKRGKKGAASKAKDGKSKVELNLGRKKKAQTKKGVPQRHNQAKGRAKPGRPADSLFGPWWGIGPSVTSWRPSCALCPSLEF